MDVVPIERSTDSMSVAALLRYLVAALLLGAASFHFGAMGEHSGVSWTHGLFFAAAAWAQVGVGILLLFRPTRAVVVAGLTANVGILALWVLTRTVGLAIGGDGSPEPWALIDSLCAMLEMLGLVGLGALLRIGNRERTVRRRTGTVAIASLWIGVVLLTSAAFSPALAATDGHNHSGPQTNGHSGMDMPMP